MKQEPLTSPPPPHTTLADLEYQWCLSDALFQKHITSKHALATPIALRNPFIFYLGHLAAFTSIQLLSTPTNREFDQLFERGRDPDVDDPSLCHSHSPIPVIWPSWSSVMAYRDSVQTAVRAVASTLSARRLRIVAEHEAMHAETLSYMLAQHLRSSTPCCTRTSSCTHTSSSSSSSLSNLSDDSVEWISIAAGTTACGQSPSVDDNKFGWDNEYGTERVHVGAFQMARTAVSVAEYAQFVMAGGYANEQWWTPSDWEWLKRDEVRHPVSWECDGTGYPARILTCVGPGVNFDLEVERKVWLQWPVSVSLAEARAYARWKGVRLPSEAEWTRAAYGTAEKQDCEEVTVNQEGPRDVQEGATSWCGVVSLIGNGWELTNTDFKPFKGFQRMKEFPVYSADFFDGKHCVLKGASWATSQCMVRRSFRNFYHERYPYVFTKIRLARDEEETPVVEDEQ